MVFIKRLIILSGDNAQNSNGVVKLERVGKQITCDCKLFFGYNDKFLAIMENDKMIYCDKASNFRQVIQAESKLDGDIKAIVFDNQAIISKGSTKGSQVSFEYIYQMAKRLIAEQEQSASTLAENYDNVEVNSQESFDNVDNNQQAEFSGQVYNDGRKYFKQKNTNKLDSNDKNINVDNDYNSNMTVDHDVKNNKDTAEMLDYDINTASKNINDHGSNKKTSATTTPASNIDTLLRQGKRYNKEGSFYEHISSKLEELMSTQLPDDELQILIPGSKWVRVPTQDDDFYVVGIISEEGIPKLICYGVPDKNKNNPPKCKSQARQWLELEKDSRGYWMMYQDAYTGKTLESSTIS